MRAILRPPATALKFSHDPAYRYAVSNLSGSEFFAFDITDAADVGRVTGFAISGSGPYTPGI